MLGKKKKATTILFLTKPGFVSFEKVRIIFNLELQQKHGGHFCDGEFAKQAPYGSLL
jgi:hypothetical protein